MAVHTSNHKLKNYSLKGPVIVVLEFYDQFQKWTEVKFLIVVLFFVSIFVIFFSHFHTFSKLLIYPLNVATQSNQKFKQQIEDNTIVWVMAQKKIKVYFKILFR